MQNDRTYAAGYSIDYRSRYTIAVVWQTTCAMVHQRKCCHLWDDAVLVPRTSVGIIIGLIRRIPWEAI